MRGWSGGRPLEIFFEECFFWGGRKLDIQGLERKTKGKIRTEEVSREGG